MSISWTSVCVCMCVLVTQPCSTLCDPVDYSSPGSSVHGILWERILEWVAMPSSRGSSWPSDTTLICIHSDSLPSESPGKPSWTSTQWQTQCQNPKRNNKVSLSSSIQSTMCMKVTQSCLTLCNLIDCSPPGSSVHGILQVKYWSG